MATKERLAAMAASLCAVCSGVMVAKLVMPDPRDSALELRTYVCAECGHSRTYSVDAQQALPILDSRCLRRAHVEQERGDIDAYIKGRLISIELNNNLAKRKTPT